MNLWRRSNLTSNPELVTGRSAAAQDLRKRNPRYRKPARKRTPVWLQELQAK